MKKHPPVVVVDENDVVIGSAPINQVWKKGLIHRIVRIMAVTNNGHVLLQKRSKHMDLYPGCWDHSAAGHVDEGETYDQAAKRELAEELGVVNMPLTETAYYKTTGTFKDRKLNRFNKLYTVLLDIDTQFIIEKYEVNKVRWFTLDEVKRLIAEHPEQLTDGLTDVMKKYF